MTFYLRTNKNPSIRPKGMSHIKVLYCYPITAIIRHTFLKEITRTLEFSRRHKNLQKTNKLKLSFRIEGEIVFLLERYSLTDDPDEIF